MSLWRWYLRSTAHAVDDHAIWVRIVYHVLSVVLALGVVALALLANQYGTALLWRQQGAPR